MPASNIVVLFSVQGQRAPSEGEEVGIPLVATRQRTVGEPLDLEALARPDSGEEGAVRLSRDLPPEAGHAAVSPPGSTAFKAVSMMASSAVSIASALASSDTPCPDAHDLVERVPEQPTPGDLCRRVAGATTSLGEGMARLVRGPDWAPMGTSDVKTPNTVAETDTPAVEEVAV